MPNSVWCGLRHKDFKFEYFNGAKPEITTQTASGVSYFGDSGNMYGTYGFVLPCGTKTVEVGNQNLSLPVHFTNSEFNEIKLTSNKTTNSVNINNVTPLNCSFNTATALITSNRVISSVQ